MDLAKKNTDKWQARNTKRIQNTDLTTMVYGKIPPQAKDLEDAVLGAIMIETSAFDRVAELMIPEAFYVNAHQLIFEAMKRLQAKAQPLDRLTLAEELRISGQLEMVGGDHYLTKLTSAVVSSANIETHCRIILQKYVQREVIRAAGDLLSQAYEDMADAFELLELGEEMLTNIAGVLSVGNMVRIDTVLVQAMKKIEEWRQLQSPVTGVPSGYHPLDKATRGWQNTDFIILAARPSVGKTAFALNLVKNAAAEFLRLFHAGQPHKSVAVWSLEMKAVMLVLRMMSEASEEGLYNMQTGRLDEFSLKNIYAKAIQQLSQMNIYFDDSPGMTVPKVRSKARKLKRQNNLGLILIDYLQLLEDEGKGNREQQVSKISRNLKLLAMELDVPIIALSQMSRDFEKRTGPLREPMLSDLRESGSIEQDADVVCFLWGPTDAEIGEDASLLNRRYLKIAKQRNGVLTKIDLDFRDEIQRFVVAEKFGEVLNIPSSYKPISLPKDFTESNRRSDDDVVTNEQDLPF